MPPWVIYIRFINRAIDHTWIQYAIVSDLLAISIDNYAGHIATRGLVPAIRLRAFAR